MFVDEGGEEKAEEEGDEFASMTESEMLDDLGTISDEEGMRNFECQLAIHFFILV